MSTQPKDLSEALAGLADLHGAGPLRRVPDGGDAYHRASCPVCRKIKPGPLIGIELSWIAWASTVAELAQAHGITQAGNVRFLPSDLSAHFAFYGLDLVRVGRIGTAYAQLVEAGIGAARNGGATADTALKALRELADLGGPAGSGAPAPGGSAPEQTWEAMVSARGTGPIPGQLAHAVAQGDEDEPAANQVIEAPAARADGGAATGAGALDW